MGNLRFSTDFHIFLLTKQKIECTIKSDTISKKAMQQKMEEKV